MKRGRGWGNWLSGFLALGIGMVGWSGSEEEWETEKAKSCVGIQSKR